MVNKVVSQITKSMIHGDPKPMVALRNAADEIERLENLIAALATSGFMVVSEHGACMVSAHAEAIKEVDAIVKRVKS